jgi:O-antigen/teichoic acid export membrane protein
MTSLVSLAILVRLLSVKDYATYRQTLLAYNFISPLLVLGLPKALYYFIPREENRARGVLLENLLLLGGLGGVFFLFLLLGGSELLAWRFRNPDLVHSLVVLAPYPLFMLPAGALTACLMAMDQVKLVAWFNIFSRFIMLLTVVTATLAWGTPLAAVVGTVVGAGIVLLPSLYFMFRATRQTSNEKTYISIKEQLKFSAPLGLGNVINRTALGLDKVVVASLCTPEVFAVYANGAIEIPLVRILTGSMTSVLVPEMSSLCQQNRYREALELVKRGAAKCALILYPTMFAMFGLAHELIILLFSETYLESILPFRLFLLILPIRVMNYGAMFMAAGKSHLILIRSAGDLLFNLGLTILMVKLMGYIGAAVAALGTIYLWHMPFNTYYIRRTYDQPLLEIYPWLELGRIFLLCALTSSLFVFKSFLSTHSVLGDLAIFGGAYMVITYGLMVKFNWLSLEWLKRSLTGK